MSSHPEVDIAGEFPLLPSLASEIGSELPGCRVSELVGMLNRIDLYRNFAEPAPDLSALVDRQRVSVAEVYRAMLSRREAIWKGNKTPQNCENMDRLLHLFPDGKFVLVVRDVRDICLSWHRKWGKNPLLCAERWRARTLRGLNCLAALPDGQGIVVRYEEVLADLETVSRRLCDFLGLDFSSNMLDYHEHVEEAIDGKRKFGEPIDPANAGKWRTELSGRSVRRIEEIAYEAMQRLGYVPEMARAPGPIKAVEKYAGYGQDACAILVVGNRYSTKNRLRDRIRRGKTVVKRRLHSR